MTWGLDQKMDFFLIARFDICMSRCSSGPCRHVQEKHRLMLSRHVQVQLIEYEWFYSKYNWRIFYPRQIGGFHLITSRIYCFIGAILAMHNYGLIIYKNNSNAISLSLSSLCVVGRGLTIPDDGKGMEPTTAKGAWVWFSSVLIVGFIFYYFLSSNLWSSGNVLTVYRDQKAERLETGGPCWLLKLRWMGTQTAQMKGVLPWLFDWACRASTRDFCSALAALVGPVQNIFFSLPYIISIQLSPFPCKLGGQPCLVACLLVCVSA